MVEATTPAPGSNDAHFSVLPDPLPDRPLTDAQCPRMINKPMQDSSLWGENGLPDWRLLKEFLAREGPIMKPQIMRIMQSTL